jgi:hypothetical protein
MAFYKHVPIVKSEAEPGSKNLLNAPGFKSVVGTLIHNNGT